MLKPSRPLGVSVLGILWALSMVLLLIAASEMWHGRLGTLRISQSLSDSLPQRAPYAAVFGLISGVIAFGLWEMQNWARIVTIVVSLLDLIRNGVALFALFIVSGHTAPFEGFGEVVILALVVSLAIDLTIVVYLTRPAVSRAFREAF